jgi:hypothetical protein
MDGFELSTRDEHKVEPSETRCVIPAAFIGLPPICFHFLLITSCALGPRR